MQEPSARRGRTASRPRKRRPATKELTTRFEAEYLRRGDGTPFQWSAPDRTGIVRSATACENDPEKALKLLAEFVRRMNGGDAFYTKSFRPAYIASQVNTLRVPVTVKANGATPRHAAQIQISPAAAREHEIPGRKELPET